MKRKLDANDVPSPEGAETTSETQTETQTTPEVKDADFETLNLDPRLRQALIKEKFTKPTLVQAKAIPLALAGKDILARAKTGSGKTAAYVLPILQTILQKKAADPSLKATTGLILVPTRELAEQVQTVVTTFAAFCGKDIRSVNLTQKVSDAVQRTLLADYPDLVVSTPARVIANLGNSALSLDNLAHLVIDEADLVLSYGYDEDINALAKAIPRGVQTFLMSATLTSEVDTLKGLFCRNPVVLKLEDKEEQGAGVSQFVVRCAEDEKFLLTYVIFKLQLIKGKVIIFVGDVDRCYRVKLFLEQFGIKSCVLNSELPVNSRIHVVQEFNKGVYDIIIAADDQEVLGAKKSRKTKDTTADAAEADEEGLVGSSDDEEDVEDTTTTTTTKKSKKATPETNSKRRKVSTKDKDYGISRGIDFQNVACVLNFDLPTTAKSYTHRIGRTGRAGKTGMALSFVVPADQYGRHKPTSFPTAKHDETVVARIVKRQAKLGHEVKPYHFEMAQVDAFRYRMTDALRAITRLAVQEARAREIRQELIKSEKLKRHFEENPDELRQLRHDGELRAARIQPHLKHIPEYLMPAKGRKGISSETVGYVGFRKVGGENRIRKAREKNRGKGKGGRKPGGGGRKVDPLKTFNRGRK
ncbi:ATP dependent RNA helicase [Aspergillus japonicus CBS 114.51]|uniref:RNA helicase n=1 Tax=Aspergillus japonicus CBS 114.51 TaxID=1448312 RepID=A0A8T8X5R9_ASPJA|nr:ATP dependent RNA helicase [Aspergillus japonicus CBS 114.51]RAH83264.1 ATP dependent RNA helicase [Aspergillus japonicus CBS 114.51]